MPRNVGVAVELLESSPGYWKALGGTERVGGSRSMSTLRTVRTDSLSDVVSEAIVRRTTGFDARKAIRWLGADGADACADERELMQRTITTARADLAEAAANADMNQLSAMYEGVPDAPATTTTTRTDASSRSKGDQSMPQRLDANDPEITACFGAHTAAEQAHLSDEQRARMTRLDASRTTDDERRDAKIDDELAFLEQHRARQGEQAIRLDAAASDPDIKALLDAYERAHQGNAA